MQTKWISSIAGVALAFSTANAFADHTETVIGAAVGGATGAAIGQRIGGRNDVIIWSALGGATGAVLGRGFGESHERRTVIVRERPRYADNDDYVVVRRPVREEHIYYEDEPHYWRHGRDHEHHHERDWDDDD